MLDVDLEPLVWSIFFGLMSIPQRDGVNCAGCIGLSALCAWLALIAPLVWSEKRWFMYDWEFES